MNSYDQESKKSVREMMLGKAIAALTSGRHKSAIVNRDELRVTFDHFLDLIGRFGRSDELRAPAEAELQEWMAFDASCNTRRKAGELKVLYLCGPSPANDLKVLLKHGINIHNVWAITGSQEDSAAAHEQLSDLELSLKIHEGSLAEFFETNNEVFDLIYFDACGPFMGGKPSTLTPLFSIFEKQRLAPKGVLITNYAGPPDTGPARERYVHLATAYFHPRYNDIPEIVRKSDLDPAIFEIEPELLRDFTANHLEPIYSDLITKLTIDLATVIVPALRAFSMSAFMKRHASPKVDASVLIDQQAGTSIRENGLPGDRWLSPKSYPILSFVDRLEEFNPNDPLLHALRLRDQKGVSYKHLISVSELATSVVEGNWGILSPELLSALRCRWFDYDARITCDLPMPNLLVSSVVGTYGRPYFYNARQSKRVRYRARIQEMYCDLFVFEQCRSFFDWFPTVQACPSRFRSIPFQIVARCLIDRLGWANFHNTANPFSYSAVAGMQETAVARAFAIPKRSIVK